MTMATGNYTRKLSAYHDVLQRTLLDSRDITATKLISIDLELARKRLQLQQLHDDGHSLAARLESSINRWSFLDTTDLVKQEVEGQSSYHHTYKWLRPTPNFVFHLRTRFPIRKYVDSLSEESNWKTLACEEGETAFTGEVKTKAFKDGRATIALYGWRREIFASEILDLKDLVATLMDSQTSLETTIFTAKSEVTELQSERDVIQSMLNDRDRDLRILGCHVSKAPNATEGMPYLEVESISGLATFYGLISQLMNGEDNTPAIGEAMAWLIDSSHIELDSALEHLEDAKCRYSNCVSDNRKVTQDHLRTLKSIVRTKSHEKIFQNALSDIPCHLIEDNSSEIVRHALDMASDDLCRIEKSFMDEKQAIQVNWNKIDPPTARETTQIIMMELTHSINFTKRDQRAQEASRRALEGNMRHVGVVAALNSGATGSDAWMSIYRGMRTPDGIAIDDSRSSVEDCGD